MHVIMFTPLFALFQYYIILDDLDVAEEEEEGDEEEEERGGGGRNRPFCPTSMFRLLRCTAISLPFPLSLSRSRTTPSTLSPCTLARSLAFSRDRCSFNR